MAQAARERQAMTIAPRHLKPAVFGGTDAAWRVLCDLYPSAETPEIVMAVVEYCATKRLDPFKRPVHIVPMWNAKLRRRVQTVMRGINEIEIVAARTGAWAGMDLPQWGPEVERIFRGTIENDDGSARKVEATLKCPHWCAVTVYRLVGGERRAFTAQLFWEESYGTAGFRSEVPNERWSKAPHQMLHKCYSHDTEVLTDRGFYLFADVPPDARIMQVTPNGLTPVTAQPFRQEYTGPMIRARGTGLNFCVTPDHGMVLADGKRIDAGEMFKQTRVRPKFWIPLHGPRSTNLDYSITDDAIRLSAWYLCDGTDRPYDGFVVSVSRQRKIDALNEIAVTARVSIRHCAGDVSVLGDQEIITRSDKTNFTYRLSDCGGLVHSGKLIDQETLLRLSHRQTRLFIETMLDGDGSRTHNGTKLFHASHDHVLRAFELACVLAGWSVSQRTPHRAPTGQIGYVVTVGRRPTGRVRLLSPSAPQAYRADEDEGWFAGIEMVANASGEVWCVSVPSGAIIVRREGQSMVCGNCTKAAVLRTAFPEEGLGYAAEEMEDRPIDTGGITIEGTTDHGDPGLTDRDRETKQAPPSSPPDDATAGLALLEERTDGVWLKNLETLLKGAATEAQVAEIAEHPRVRSALEKAPSLIRRQISDMVHAAREKTAPDQGDPPDDGGWPEQVTELIAEVEAMDEAALDTLANSAAWRAKTRDLFPPDDDLLREAIAARKAALKG
jgi:phage recombination protein Bet